MSPLRKEALQLVESLPEENLFALIQLMAKQSENLSREELLAKKQNSFEQLQKFVDNHNVFVPPDFDYKEELAQYREERLGHANFG